MDKTSVACGRSVLLREIGVAPCHVEGGVLRAAYASPTTTLTAQV